MLNCLPPAALILTFKRVSATKSSITIFWTVSHPLQAFGLQPPLQALLLRFPRLQVL